MAAPFKSKLRDYASVIRAWRRAGYTWKEVSDNLSNKHGIKADPGNLCRFMKRLRKKPYPIGAEPETLPPIAHDDTDIYDLARDRHLSKRKSKSKVTLVVPHELL